MWFVGSVVLRFKCMTPNGALPPFLQRCPQPLEQHSCPGGHGPLVGHLSSQVPKMGPFSWFNVGHTRSVGTVDVYIVRVINYYDDLNILFWSSNPFVSNDNDCATKIGRMRLINFSK